LPSADPTPTSTSPKEAVEQRPAVELVEPPRRQGKNTRYWISANHHGFDVLGVACPGGEKLKWLQKEASGAEEDSIRQFRLRDGRHALAVYDDSFFYSLVLIYKLPAAGGRGRTRVAVKSKDGSLEAWLLRHEGHEHGEHYLPLDQWQRLLSSSAEERTRQAKTFRLEGTARVREDEFGLLAEMADMDLRCLKPLPPFTEFLDFRQKQIKEDFAAELTMVGVDVKELKLTYESELGQLAFWRKNPTKEKAMIRGWVIAGWAPPLRSKASP
jgi:hypothetical protein